jgi:hypothetical protein
MSPTLDSNSQVNFHSCIKNYDWPRSLELYPGRVVHSLVVRRRGIYTISRPNDLGEKTSITLQSPPKNFAHHAYASRDRSPLQANQRLPTHDRHKRLWYMVDAGEWTKDT